MKNKTLAKQLKINNFPFMIKDNKGNCIYFEESDDYWMKNEFDQNNNLIYNADSKNYWYKCEYNHNNHVIFWENSDNVWFKYEVNEKGEWLYMENSRGESSDFRKEKVIEITFNDIAKLLNVPVEKLKLKK